MVDLTNISYGTKTPISISTLISPPLALHLPLPHRVDQPLGGWPSDHPDLSEKLFRSQGRDFSGAVMTLLTRSICTLQ